jgi:hypothetical protein
MRLGFIGCGGLMWGFFRVREREVGALGRWVLRELGWVGNYGVNKKVSLGVLLKVTQMV